ncbi:sodium ion-translocating decarboxylase subunit beta [Candidatus Arthromitus sp. SFB-rat-Yit]|uniref:sodium ion-translocating decarboxylase subunit beta n=1 Tax=Candidatus Arthromitus sp. SFB-rat-Yit TaxID=1041504 RepID=UPI000227A4F9|nr:sodium ion-translocating decarboxylase subunit beta [Candidatus Arthromitus sp. SFB-rat-Yit]BAK81578.1 Na+ transporting oxaloacetate decarboxylase beta chain [Candidatus Arthromitus sp. SFB-rat-Yit]
MNINFLDMIYNLYSVSGIKFLIENPSNLIMILISLVFMYLAIFKKYEPYLLLPIAFGMFLVNFPVPVGEGLMDEGGLLYILYQGVKLGIFPPLIFMAIGASIDFAPLIASPKNFLLGAASQIGIFVAFLIAMYLGFSVNESASIGIIGGADGPTAIYLTSKLAPHQLGSIAIAAYSYMALIPVIQPPIIKLLTSKKERRIKMVQLREVSKTEKIIFPIIVTALTALIIPSSITLVGMLMFGNLIKESGVVPQLVENIKNALLYVVTVFIGITVGATATAQSFLQFSTIKIIILGLIAFVFGTAFGVIFGKIMCVFTKGKVNPMIGAAGVSAVPMAARVVHKIGVEEDPSNFLLMHAMGPNVAGVIGSAVAAGVLLSIFA